MVDNSNAYAALNTINQGANTLLNAYAQYQNNQTAQKNLDLQKEAFGYNQSLNDIIFQREDNAVQRRVNDLLKAGLNPLLAAGSGAGSGGTVSAVNAPQSQKKWSNPNAMNPGEIFSMLIALRQARAEISSIAVANERSKTENEIARYNLDWYKKYDLPTNATGIPKMVGEGASMIEGFIPKVKETAETVGNSVSESLQSKVQNVQKDQDYKSLVASRNAYKSALSNYEKHASAGNKIRMRYYRNQVDNLERLFRKREQAYYDRWHEMPKY